MRVKFLLPITYGGYSNNKYILEPLDLNAMLHKDCDRIDNERFMIFHGERLLFPSSYTVDVENKVLEIKSYEKAPVRLIY